MRLITNNIIREHIGPFIFSLSTIVFVFLLNIIFRDLGRLIGKGLPVRIILEFIFLNMAWIAALAIPMAVLMATLMAFGRMSQDNEITALKSSGVNLYRIIRPIFLLSILLTLGMERFNNIVLPEFNHRLNQLYVDISKKRPTATIEPNVFFNELEDFSLLVNKIKEDSLEGIYINDKRDPKFSRRIIAKKGILKFIEEEERLVFDLRDGEFHEMETSYFFARQPVSLLLLRLQNLNGTRNPCHSPQTRLIACLGVTELEWDPGFTASVHEPVIGIGGITTGCTIGKERFKNILEKIQIVNWITK